MNSFELNKIMGAILGTCLLLMVTNFAAQAVFSPKPVEKPGYDIAVKEVAAGDAKGAHVHENYPVEAQRVLWRDMRSAIEPGGAAALAALLSGAYRPARDERLGVLLCGANVALDTLGG